MRLVSYAVLGASIMFGAVGAWAAQTQSVEAPVVVHSDPDVAKLLAVVNDERGASKGLKQVAVNIDEHGKPKNIWIVGCGADESSALQQRIRRVSFETGPKVRAKKIKLIFRK